MKDILPRIQIYICIYSETAIKWPHNGGWPLNRGSLEIGIIFSRNLTLF